MVKRTVTIKAPELRSQAPKIQRWPRRSAEDLDAENLKIVFKVLDQCRKSHPGWKSANINYESGEVVLSFPSFHEAECERLQRRIKSVNIMMDVEKIKKSLGLKR